MERYVWSETLESRASFDHLRSIGDIYYKNKYFLIFQNLTVWNKQIAFYIDQANGEWFYHYFAIGMIISVLFTAAGGSEFCQPD
jgi:hypothetical protein